MEGRPRQEGACIYLSPELTSADESPVA